ncbi:MAG: hypothetical protein QGH83_14930 [Candidatus Pacebacteria bacterium]|jgi:hypothetical protein|nr:hypothetical protein [Candidatus Paceibacterota bacterium]|tara:strand:- start:1540 stop:2061 length:522 start_codon:yes stop_codon:yes gene_type:complete
MFSKKEILLWIVIFFVGIMLSWSCKLEAADVDTKPDPKRNLYPNVLMYNSTASCIQGVVALLLSSNPSMRNQMMPPAVIQQMIGHCSCVMDKIRLLHSVEEYYANMHDYIWIRNMWGKYGAECIDMGYLAGLVTKGKQPSDNKTIEKPKPIEPEPKQPQTEQLLDSTGTSFQG